MTTWLRNLPSVDKIISDDRLQQLVQEYSHQAVLDLIRNELDKSRISIIQEGRAPSIENIIQNIQNYAVKSWCPWPSPVINATGVILHTNLGRAPLSEDSINAISTVALGYSDLELNLHTGKRGSRNTHISNLLCQLTGADDALAVNNNASAFMLGIATLAPGREVIVSRGQAVEIGGGFRIPDVLTKSGATLVEVGTTNRTYVHDYEMAITDKTAAIVYVHSSNFQVTGFTHSPRLSELVKIGTDYNIPLLYDLGSGCLLDTTDFGLDPEPTPQQIIAEGVSLVFFSGDKLMGGPQSGIIVGKQELVSTMARHPFCRAIRIDKMSSAALATTLLHYIRQEAVSKIPIWQMISQSQYRLKQRASELAKSLGPNASIIKGHSTLGGGSLPGGTLPTTLVKIDGVHSIESLASKIRNGTPHILARIENEALLLDPRTVNPKQDHLLVEAVTTALESITTHQSI